MSSGTSGWLHAARVGVRRGGLEIRHTFTSSQDLWNYLFPSAILLVVMFFMRGAAVPGIDFSLGSRTLPGVLGMNIAFGGMVTLMMSLALEREDGTLLRAKAVPNGMLGYLVALGCLVVALYGLHLITLFGLIFILLMIFRPNGLLDQRKELSRLARLESELVNALGLAVSRSSRMKRTSPAMF